MTRQQYDQYSQIGITQGVQPEEIIERMANRLLESLYKPVMDDRQWVACPPEDIASEAINWGALNAYVEKIGDGYQVVLDECSPECYNLMEYVKSHLDIWGWECSIKCEW